MANFNAEQLRKNLIEFLDKKEKSISDPLFCIFSEYMNHDYSNEVDFSLFSLEDAKHAQEAIYYYVTAEGMEWDEDPELNDTNPFHHYFMVNDVMWHKIWNLPAKKMENDYF